MNPFFENWRKELNDKWMQGHYLSSDDHHRREVLNRDHWREKKINQANQELPWGGAWWKAMQKIRGNEYAYEDDEEKQ